MSLKDINWGGVILGALAVTGIVGFAMATGGAGASLLAAFEGQTALAAATLSGAAVAGGVLGNIISKACARVQDAATTLVQR